MILIKNKHFGFFCFVFDISKTLPKMTTNFWRAPMSTVEVKSKKNVYSQLIHLCSHTNLDSKPIPTGRDPRHFINKKNVFFENIKTLRTKVNLFQWLCLACTLNHRSMLIEPWKYLVLLDLIFSCIQWDSSKVRVIYVWSAPIVSRSVMTKTSNERKNFHFKSSSTQLSEKHLKCLRQKNNRL